MGLIISAESLKCMGSQVTLETKLEVSTWQGIGTSLGSPTAHVNGRGETVLKFNNAHEAQSFHNRFLDLLLN